MPKDQKPNFVDNPAAHLPCPACKREFALGGHGRCQWIIHPDLMIEQLAQAAPVEDRAELRAGLISLFYGDRKPKALPTDPVGERAYLERLETQWWEESGKPALLAAYPLY